MEIDKSESRIVDVEQKITKIAIALIGLNTDQAVTLGKIISLITSMHECSSQVDIELAKPNQYISPFDHQMAKPVMRQIVKDMLGDKDE